jgi:hypothetical protein
MENARKETLKFFKSRRRKQSEASNSPQADRMESASKPRSQESIKQTTGARFKRASIASLAFSNNKRHSVSLRALIYMYKLHQQETYFKTCLMQVFIMVTYISVVFLVFDSSSIWYQNDIVNQHVLDASFTNKGDLRVFTDINDFDSLWQWFEGPVMSNIYPDVAKQDQQRRSLLYNKYFHMMGTFQIRQVRVNKTSKKLKNKEFEVWPDYSPEQEDSRKPSDIWANELAQYVKHPTWQPDIGTLPDLAGNPRITSKGSYGKSGYVVEMDSNYTRTRCVTPPKTHTHTHERHHHHHHVAVQSDSWCRCYVVPTFIFPPLLKHVL